MILDVIGALLRFVFSSILAKIKGNESKTFSDFIDDKKKGIAEKLDSRASDTIIGGIFLTLVLVLIYVFT